MTCGGLPTFKGPHRTDRLAGLPDNAEDRDSDDRADDGIRHCREQRRPRRLTLWLHRERPYDAASDGRRVTEVSFPDAAVPKTWEPVRCLRTATTLLPVALTVRRLPHTNLARRPWPRVTPPASLSSLLQVLGEQLVHLEHRRLVLAEHLAQLVVGDDHAAVVRAL